MSFLLLSCSCITCSLARPHLHLVQNNQRTVHTRHSLVGCAGRRKEGGREGGEVQASENQRSKLANTRVSSCSAGLTESGLGDVVSRHSQSVLPGRGHLWDSHVSLDQSPVVQGCADESGSYVVGKSFVRFIRETVFTVTVHLYGTRAPRPCFN